MSYDKEVDIKGNGLSYQWVNKSLERKMVDVEWFDSPRGIGQFIRGSTTKYFEYQWDVQTGAIPGPYEVHITDACGDTFVSNPINVSSYGTPTVNTSTVAREYIVGDTFRMEATPDILFDTLKYAWAKGEFFMFDWKKIQGTSTTNFSINGVDGEHTGIYRVISYHPQCPDYYGESVPYNLVVNTNDTINDDWKLGVRILQNENIKIHPNPFLDEVQVEIISKAPSQLEILNSQGQTIESRELSGSSITVVISHWPPGCYFLRLYSGNSLLTKRIMKL